MPDHSGMKLGRKAIKTDSRTLRLGDYLTPTLAAAPAAVDWTKGITGWGMMLNDQIGTCTIAAAAHAVQVWSANKGAIQTVADSDLEAAYAQWAGYVVGDASTDTGGAELDVLNGWKKGALGGHQLVAFADPTFSNLDEIRQAIALFGGVYVGFDLPLTSQNQDVWDVVPTAGDFAKKGSWGGHCVFVPQYDATSFTCITWGQLKKMTLAFWSAYCDEAHALLGKDWLDFKATEPGFDQNQLMADLQAIR